METIFAFVFGISIIVISILLAYFWIIGPSKLHRRRQSDVHREQVRRRHWREWQD